MKRVGLVAGLCLASCSGGGSGGGGPTSAAFQLSGATHSENSGTVSIPVVLRTTLPMLEAPVTVTVIDRGSGSAQDGLDYPAIAPQVVTFDAGAVDGDVQFALVAITNDALIEGATETIVLGLTAPNGTSIASPTTFTASITDGDVATLQFSTSATSTFDEGSGSVSVPIALDLPAGVQLATAVSLTVANAGTGSATSGSDHSAFATRTVVFPAGSIDGTTLGVTIGLLDDAVIEVDETIRLVLSLPSPGAVLGVAATVDVTIRDDDATGPAAFVATEGADGTGNALVHDELLHFGSAVMNSGPTTGTLVRVSNAGDLPLELAAPRLTGSHPNDFSVTIDSASIVEAALVTTSGDPELAMPSPLLAHSESAGAGIVLAYDAVVAADLATMTRASVHGFPLPGVGSTTLELQRMPLPIAEDAVLRVDGVEQAGGPRAIVGDLSIWTGNVLEAPGSRVFLALSSHGPQGFIELPGPVRHRVHLALGAGNELRAVDGDAGLAALGFTAPTFTCESIEALIGVEPASNVPSTSALVETGSMDVAECRIAIETDYQLYAKFGSTGTLTSYVTQLVGAVSSQYFEDVQTVLVIAYLGVHTTAADPWIAQDSGGTPGALLNEFVGAWAPNNWPVSANLAHFLSGANLGGGVAYVGALCSTSFGFGVSANISGTIAWGTWTGAPGNFTWDFVVLAHELGHNFGSSHTHSYCPPLDLCASNCNGTTVCSQGTIMSYCHACGGMDNIDLEFHPVTANIMRQSVNASCLGRSGLSGGEHVQYRVRFDPRTATGARSATLELVHDAANEPSPFRVLLGGTAQ